MAGEQFQKLSVIDATGAIAGRLASIVAKRALLGERIIIVNAEKAVITGDPKRVVKLYLKRVVEVRTHYNPEKTGPKIPRRPDRILKRIIRGMLPYKRWKGRRAFKRIRVYVGVPDEYKNIKPEVVEEALLKDPSKPHITLEELSRLIGGWPPPSVRKKLSRVRK